MPFFAFKRVISRLDDFLQPCSQSHGVPILWKITTILMAIFLMGLFKGILRERSCLLKGNKSYTNMFPIQTYLDI